MPEHDAPVGTEVLVTTPERTMTHSSGSPFPDSSVGDVVGYPRGRGDRREPDLVTSVECNLPTGLQSDEAGLLVDELRRKFETVADVERRVRSQVVDYPTMGGTVDYVHDGFVESADELTSNDYARLRGNVRDALYREIPGFESVRTIADRPSFAAFRTSFEFRDSSTLSTTCERFR